MMQKFKCFARWRRGRSPELYFRDQTLLQFGDGWKLIASLVLQNPGSAEPASEDSKNKFLSARGLAYFLPPKRGEDYFSFKPDNLMSCVFRLLGGHFPSGVIKLYNLFNLRNQDSKAAFAQVRLHSSEPAMFSQKSEINFAGRPVIIATGQKAIEVPRLRDQLKRYVELCDPSRLYSISKSEENTFCVTPAKADADGLVTSFHPSYTCKYGNSTEFKGFRAR